MRIRLLVLFAALALALVPGDLARAAVSGTCLPTLPATPGVPSVALRLTSPEIDVTLWRQACADGSGEVALLMRATPVSPEPFFCGFQLLATQGGLQRALRIRKGTQTDAIPFCDNLFTPTTVVVDEAFGEPPFDEDGAFTLIWRSFPASTYDIPAAGAQPPPPSVQVVIAGCPCGPDALATIKLVYVNPGPAQTIDLRFGARLPNGGTLGVLHDLLELPTGTSEAILHEGPFPNVTRGFYELEAALLDPVFGVTLSRHSAGLHLVP